MTIYYDNEWDCYEDADGVLIFDLEKFCKVVIKMGFPVTIKIKTTTIRD